METTGSLHLLTSGLGTDLPPRTQLDHPLMWTNTRLGKFPEATLCPLTGSRTSGGTDYHRNTALVGVSVKGEGRNGRLSGVWTETPPSYGDGGRVRGREGRVGPRIRWLTSLLSFVFYLRRRSHDTLRLVGEGERPGTKGRHFTVLPTVSSVQRRRSDPLRTEKIVEGEDEILGVVCSLSLPLVFLLTGK